MDLIIEVNRIAYSKFESRLNYYISITQDGNKFIEKFSVISSLPVCERIQKGYISVDDYEKILRASKLTEAINRGMCILEYGECPKKALVLKLRQRGFSQEISTEAVEYLSEHHWLNENELAIRKAQIQMQQLMGKKRIFAYLKNKGFGEEAINSVKAYLEDMEIDFVELCAKAIMNKYPDIPTDPKEKDKMYSHFIRMGYTSSEIKEAIRLLKNQ